MRSTPSPASPPTAATPSMMQGIGISFGELVTRLIELGGWWDENRVDSPGADFFRGRWSWSTGRIPCMKKSDLR